VSVDHGIAPARGRSTAKERQQHREDLAGQRRRAALHLAAIAGDVAQGRRTMTSVTRQELVTQATLLESLDRTLAEFGG
jgi:hypothetical protein